MPILPHIVSQHAEEAAFLWLLRDRAVGEPHYRLKDLAKLDNRVEAHLDGLRVAGDEGWELLEAELKWEEPGEIFAAAAIALEGAREERIRRSLDAATPQPALRRAFASALGWSPTRVAEPFVQRLLASPTPGHRHIGVMAAAVRRMDLKDALAPLGRDDDPHVRARALRAMGETARGDLASLLAYQTGEDDPACRFWALWSHALLGGSQEALRLLLGIAEEGGRFADRAVGIAFRLMSPSSSGPVRDTWAKRPERLRRAIVAAGVAGDPEALPWLLDHMTEPATARVAGEAFSMISGADLAYLDLDRNKPEGFEPGPTENPEDEDVALDPDENLPFPDADRCRRWWEAHRREWTSGQRHLCGAPVKTAQLQEVLKGGFQRQRAAAAVELSLRNPGRALFEWRARGFRQIAALAAAATIALASTAQASWDPAGVRLSGASDTQSAPLMLALAGGRSAVVWTAGTPQRVRARLLDADGAALIPELVVCPTAGDQTRPIAVPDDSGGVIVAWEDARNADMDVYAQRVDALGRLRWGASALGISGAANAQQRPTLAADGSGGAIVAWEDWRGAGPDVYAQRVRPDGTVAWTAGGLLLSGNSAADTAGTQQLPRAAPDDAGGAFVCWDDGRHGSPQVYTQAIDAAGTKWANAVHLSSIVDPAQSPVISRDGSGGAFIAWSVPGATGSAQSLKAQHQARDGTPWGAEVGATTRDGAVVHGLVPGSGGVVDVVFSSPPAGSVTTWRIAVRRVRSAGALDIKPTNLDSLGVSSPAVSVSAAGADTVCLAFERGGVVRVLQYTNTLPNGANPDLPLASWGAIAVTSATAAQSGPACAVSDRGEPLVAWADDRNSPGSGTDVFAQRLSPAGEVAAHRIDVVPGPGGSSVPSEAAYVAHDGTLDVTLHSDPNYHVESLRVGGIDLGPRPNYRFRDVTADSLLEGQFSNSPVHASLVTSAIAFLPFALPFVGQSIAALTQPLGGPESSVWRLGHWNPVTSGYVEAGAGLDSVRAGRGYWLITRNAASLDATEALLPEADFSIPLESPSPDTPAWNQIGNPFRFAIGDSDLVVVSGTGPGATSRAFFDAGNGITEKSIRYWNPATGQYEVVRALEPGRAYWVRYLAGANPRLVFPFRAPANGVGTLPARPALAAWSIAVTATRPGHGAGRLVVGAADVPRGTWNELGRARPPLPPVPACDVYVVREGWGRASGEYVGDFVAPDSLLAWDLRAESSGPLGATTLAFQFDGVPANARVQLIDASAGWAREIADGERVELALGQVARALRLVVSTTGAATLGSPGSRPALRAVAPMPFRERTTLAFSLPAATDFAFEVYDLAGRHVYGIRRAALPPGDHVETWDGRCEDGRRAAPGVYLARWRALGHSGSARLVLLP